MGPRAYGWIAIAFATGAATAASCSSGGAGGDADAGAIDGGDGGDDDGSGDAAPCGSSDDPKNCGACGHDCLGGACKAGVCQPFVMATGQLAPTSIAVDAQGVYWTNAGSSTGSSPFADGAVMCIPSGAASPKALASNEPAPDHLRAAGGALYWSSVVSWHVNRMPNGGGAIAQLNAGETDGQPVMGLAVDADAGIVAWTESGAGVVRSATLDGGSLSTLALADGGADAGVVPAGIALDATSIYFSILTPTPSIVRMDRTCVAPCTQELLAPTGHAYPIASDYYSDSIAHLVSALAGGPAAVDIRAALGNDSGLMMDVTMDDGWVYWTEYGPTSGSAPSPRTSSGVVVRARRDLGGREVLASGLNHPRGIAVDDKAIYWTNAGTRTGDCPACCDPGCFDRADGEVVRLAKPLVTP